MEIYFGVLFLVMVYCTYDTLVKGHGLSHRWDRKYTKESLRAYSKYAGVGCLLGAIVCLVMIFVSLGVINLGINFDENKTAKIVVIVILAVLMFAPMLIGIPKLKKIDQASIGSQVKGKGKKKDEDEDF